MDVVEIFIATQDSYPYNYFEIEVSPRGQLFIADIHNPNGYCYNLGTTYYACGFAQYGAKITDEGSEAWLIIGLEFLGRGRI